LDNVLGLNEGLIGLLNGKYKKTGDLFSLSTENTKRVTRQNAKKISVIIGNPPYNANQMNENDNNKNRQYPFIDQRIKDTFIKYSTAQKHKTHDMYARFYRWAMDRLDANGIIAFITNRSFIDSRNFDGFRKCIQDEFDYAYIIDTKSGIRENPKISGTSHNIFGIRTGVAIMFLVHKDKRENSTCNIQYIGLDDFLRKEAKLQWLSEAKMRTIPFDHIMPDKNNNWLNIADTDWEKNQRIKDIFILCSNGVATGRDEWIYDINDIVLENKIRFFIKNYNDNLNKKEYDLTIKWTATLKSFFSRNHVINFEDDKIITSNYRPFFRQRYYSEKAMSDRLTANHYRINSKNLKADNICIVFTGTSSQKPFLFLQPPI